MKKIAWLGIISGISVLLFLLVCTDPINPFNIDNLKMSIILPDEEKCIAREDLEIVVEVNMPKLLEHVALQYDGQKIVENITSKIIDEGAVTFSKVNFKQTGTFEITAIAQPKNSDPSTAKETSTIIIIGDIPIIENNNMISSAPEKPQLNQILDLYVTAKGSTLEYMWFKDGDPLNQHSNIVHFDALKKVMKGCINVRLKIPGEKQRRRTSP